MPWNQARHSLGLTISADCQVGVNSLLFLAHRPLISPPPQVNSIIILVHSQTIARPRRSSLGVFPPQTLVADQLT